MKSIHNFRDFGGYPTQNGLAIKKGLLYRSGNLARASAEELQILISLGIKTICDLRTQREHSREPDRLPPHCGIRSVHIPIKARQHNESGYVSQLLSLLFGRARGLDYDEVLQEIYREYVINFRREFSEMLRLLTDSNNLPILIHCTAGKDRTGFACSLIQRILGMPTEAVMQDYLLSNSHLDRFIREMQRRLSILFIFGISRQKMLPLFEARRAYLTAALDQIKSDYRSLDVYLRKGLNFSDADRRELTETLLEKAAAT